MKLDAPFPYFGGKRKAAAEVWQRFGDASNYVEPFFGSGAVLLGRPEFSGNETINDLDGFVANFWRSIKLSPEATAEWADNPVNETDLHARHVWLVQRRESLSAALDGAPDYHDPKIAGWWAWGLSCWIGGGFCSGRGPWWPDADGKLVRRDKLAGDLGVNRQRVHLGNNGQGVNRTRPLLQWFEALSERLRRVRVCSGDWERVCGPSVTHKHGMTAVFLDPPYADAANRDPDLYAVDSLSVAHAVRKWAIANGDNPMLRIALCGYDGEHEMPPTWDAHGWDAGTGYGSQADERTENGKRERIWFSPACLGARQQGLFDAMKRDIRPRNPA